MNKQHYIKQLLEIWGYKTIPFKVYDNLMNWSMDELRLELRRYKENPQILPYTPRNIG